MMDDRSLAVLFEIVFRKEQSIKKIEEKFTLTTRQVSYAIQKINDRLDEKQQSPILLKEGQFLISESSYRHLEAYLFGEGQRNIYLSKDNRQRLLFLFLVATNEYLSLDHIVWMLGISKTTAVNDLKFLRMSLKGDHIELRYTRSTGYQLLGNEQMIRCTLIRTVIECLAEYNGEQQLQNFMKQQLKIDTAESMLLIQETSQKHQVHFFENKLKEFTYCFEMLKMRITSHGLRLTPLLVDEEAKEYFFASELLRHYELANAENIAYIYAWVMGLSAGNLLENTRDRTTIKDLVDRLSTRFESLAGIRFKDPDESQKRLYEHFKPAYYRLLYQFPIVNMLTAKIKVEYEEMYRLVEEALRPIEPIFQNPIPEDEIAFLTVHMAASIVEEKEVKTRQHNALIICPNGIGTSAILKKELEMLFPEIQFHLSRKTFLQGEIDLVFSTVINAKVLALNKPFLIVSPIMSAKEKLQVIQNVLRILQEDSVSYQIEDILAIVQQYVGDEQMTLIQNEVYKKIAYVPNVIKEEGVDYPLLSEITSEDLVTLNVVAADWEEAIRKSVQVLIDQKKVRPSYVDDMIETALESGPYIVITKNVALPHARPESGAEEIAISIATLKTPVPFGNRENDPVKYIFGLSALDNKTHLTAMAELAELLDQADFYQMLDTAKTGKEVMQFIDQFEKEGIQDENSIDRM